MTGDVQTFFFLVLWFSCLLPYTIGDVSSLKNKLHVSCFPEDNNLVVYLSPTHVQRKNVSFMVNNATWENDDWTQILTNESITDLRWTEFETNNSKYLELGSEESISFSFYAQFNFFLIIHFIDESPNSNHKDDLVQELTGGWYHFTLINKNNSLELYENEKIVPSRTRKNIATGERNISIINFNESFWKIHDLKYRWSNTASQGEPTVLKIPSSEKSCLTVYYYLCENCYLEMNSANTNKTYNLTTKIQSQLWNNVEIPLQFGLENVFDIYRRTVNSDINGTWGLDLRYCRNFKDSIVRANISHYEDYSCKILNQKDGDITTIKSSALCEEPGKLGNKCQRNCSEVLGSNFTYCEHHLICLGSNCSCAWGSSGEQCEKNCTLGTYGLNCTNACENCHDCDKITGQCPATHIANDSNKTTLLVVICVVILLIIIILVLGIVYIKYRGNLKFCSNNAQSPEAKPLQDMGNQHEQETSQGNSPLT